MTISGLDGIDGDTRKRMPSLGSIFLQMSLFDASSDASEDPRVVEAAARERSGSICPDEVS